MIGPVYFFMFLASLVIFPALGGWFIAKKYEMGIRFFCTALGGQILLLPGIASIAFSQDRAHDENPLSIMIVYGSMALVISIMTFAIMEMRKDRRKK